jgi:hypothetical protein
MKRALSRLASAATAIVALGFLRQPPPLQRSGTASEAARRVRGPARPLVVASSTTAYLV